MHDLQRKGGLGHSSWRWRGTSPGMGYASRGGKLVSTHAFNHEEGGCGHRASGISHTVNGILGTPGLPPQFANMLSVRSKFRNIVGICCSICSLMRVQTA